MGMDLSHGGHLTHGASVSASGIYYRSVFYGVDRDSERLDYDTILALAEQEKPQLIICGFSAYSRQIDFEKFASIAKQVGAHLLADISHISGLVATDIHPSPIDHADVITTTTHKTLRGPRGGMILVGHDSENRLGITTKAGTLKKYSALIDSAVMPGVQGGPLLHSIAAKAVAFKEAAEPSFADYQRQILNNARVLCQALKKGGLRIVSGGTDTHLFCVDLSDSGWTGKDAAAALDKASITVNKTPSHSIPARHLWRPAFASAHRRSPRAAWWRAIWNRLRSSFWRRWPMARENRTARGNPMARENRRWQTFDGGSFSLRSNFLCRVVEIFIDIVII